MLLDEPTRGIDVGSKAQVYALVDALVAPAQGAAARAVLVASSELACEGAAGVGYVLVRPPTSLLA